MSGEMIAILAVGVALVGVILTSNRGLRQDIRQDMARHETAHKARGTENGNLSEGVGPGPHALNLGNI